MTPEEIGASERFELTLYRLERALHNDKRKYSPVSQYAYTIGLGSVVFRTEGGIEKIIRALDEFDFGPILDAIEADGKFAAKARDVRDAVNALRQLKN